MQTRLEPKLVTETHRTSASRRDRLSVAVYENVTAVGCGDGVVAPVRMGGAVVA